MARGPGTGRAGRRLHTADTRGEYHELITGVEADDLPRYLHRPYGLSTRAPMIAISPWSKGGWVNSRGVRPHIGDSFSSKPALACAGQYHAVAPRGLRGSHLAVRFRRAGPIRRRGGAASHRATRRHASRAGR
ncbi:hypothetical protein ACU4GD_08700 [Cupriavidus basilensis]